MEVISGYSFRLGLHLCKDLYSHIYIQCAKASVYITRRSQSHAFASANSSFNVLFASATTVYSSLSLLSKDSFPFVSMLIVVCEVLPSAIYNNSAEKTVLSFFPQQRNNREKTGRCSFRPRPPSSEELLTREVNLDFPGISRKRSDAALPQSIPRAIE